MKKRLLKVASLMLAGTMVLGLTACGAEKGSKSSEVSREESSSQVESSTQTSTEEVSAEPEAFEVTYPIETDLTFKFITTDGVRHSSEFSSFDESPYHQHLKKLTGVDPEIQFVAGGPTFNMLIADKNDRPVAFNNGWFSTSQVEEWKDAGIIIDLTDYLPTYAPDFWEWINKPEMEMTKRLVTDDEGRFYYIPFLIENDYVGTYAGTAIRKDWLDECGLDVPVTLADLENVLIKFKEKYGAVLGGRLNYFNMAGFASGADAYANLTARLYIDDIGKVQLANVQPEWKELMETYHRWYEMDLFDSDFFTANASMVRQKALDGTIGVVQVSQSVLTDFLNDAEEAGNGAEWVAIEYLRTAPGEPTSMIQMASSRYDNSGATFITDKCPEELIPVILQWTNYGYTEEGIMFANFGVEGESYTLDANGNVQWTKLMTEDPIGVTAAMNKYCGAMNNMPTIKTEQMVRLRNNEVAQEAVELWIKNTEAGDHLKPNLTLSWDENIFYADNWSAISTYIGECATKFLTGEMSLDEFDNYVKEIEGMGLQQVLDAQQSAYDRFISK